MWMENINIWFLTGKDLIQVLCKLSKYPPKGVTTNFRQSF